MGLSFGHLAVVAVLVVLLFGRGKISGLMGDLAQGIKSFKRGMLDDPATLDAGAPKPVEPPRAS